MRSRFLARGQFEGGEDHAGIPHHVGKQFAENLVPVVVHAVVGGETFCARSTSRRTDGVESVADHFPSRVLMRGKGHVGLPARKWLKDGPRRSHAVVRRRRPTSRKSPRHRRPAWTTTGTRIFRELLTYMMGDSSVVFPAFELILVAKNSSASATTPPTRRGRHLPRPGPRTSATPPIDRR